MGGAVTTASPSPEVPLYQQVKDRILARVTSGDWPPGKKIPSENQLVRQLGMSRMTVNRALRELARDGVLLRVAGAGTFVAEPPRHASLIELRNIADEIRAEGGEHSARVCRCRREKADGALAERMEMAPGDEVFHVVLVHRRNDLPIQLEDRWVNPRVVPDFLDLDFTAVTPSEHLLRSVRPDEMEHVVQAVIPDAATRELLAIPVTEPCLRLERRTWNEERVVTYAVLTYPSSRYALGARYTLPSGYPRQPLEPMP
jgi:GntR family transcriptional regulator, histidine utilization repressor